ncbi:glycosyltransferase family 1 protein [Calocera cornea HHB12733]|uniref:Glycosyltransferase family 1 protein n=1 Tax=Calocera cornea HHB12733 TaxID=1353952 RepID=A0A165FFN6_9BASI|nr:glycosyltransferase family 1 protein [Calocera cornea HHB12733]
MARHIIILSFVAWGHMRPECNLAVNLARRFPHLTVSLIADADFQPNAQGEVERIVGEGEKAVLSRIRVLAAGHALAGITPQLMVGAASLDPREFRSPPRESTLAVENVVHLIMKGEDFEDDNGVKWSGVAQKPNVLISDMFLADAAVPLKKAYGFTLYMYWISIAAAYTRLYGTLAVGGQAEGYVEECAAIEADPERSKGRPFSQIAKQTFAYSGRYPDDIVRAKGLKPSYEWEDFPQEFWLPGMYWSIAAIYALVKACDGLLLPSVLALDKEGTEGIKEWFCAERARPIFSLGPQLPASYLDAHQSASSESSVTGAELTISYTSPKLESSNKVDPSIAFLDEAFAKYGANSAIYVSFGSYMVPEGKHIGYLFDVLMELEEPMPFLFATASPALQLPEGLREKVIASGKGLFVPWAPQQAVFQHPATGWVVSHCGAGGMSESLAQGMPLIAWPVAADQPQNARWMSEVLETAFELLQVRTGIDQKKAFRGGLNGTDIIGTEEAIKAEMRDVLHRARGEEGRRKRANANKAKQLIHDAHMPGGQVEQHYQLFGKVIA